jgi:hypothetical protein
MQRRLRVCCELPPRHSRGAASSSRTLAPASRAISAAHRAALPPPITSSPATSPSAHGGAGLHGSAEAGVHRVHQDRQGIDLAHQLRRQLRTHKGGIEHAAQAMRVGRQNQRNPRELGRAHSTFPGRRRRRHVAARADEQQLFFKQRSDAPARSGMCSKQHRQIDFARVQHRSQVAGEALHHMQPHIGITLAHAAYERHGQHGRGGRSKPHAHRARKARVLRNANGLRRVAQGELRLTEKGQAGFRRDRALGRALQQPGRHFALELANLLAQR